MLLEMWEKSSLAKNNLQIAIMTHKYLMELRKFVRKKDKYLRKVIENDYPDGYDSDDLRTIENNFMDKVN